MSACVLDFDSDDVLVCIEVKHDSGGHLLGLYADSIGELDVQHVGVCVVAEQHVASLMSRLEAAVQKGIVYGFAVRFGDDAQVASRLLDVVASFGAHD